MSSLVSSVQASTFPAAAAGEAAGELAATGVLQRESEEAAAMGFTGKLAIHPAQVAAINTAFLPTAQEIEQAQLLLVAARGHDGAFRFADRMVDVPHVRRAERIMALARAHALA